MDIRDVERQQKWKQHSEAETNEGSLAFNVVQLPGEGESYPSLGHASSPTSFVSSYLLPGGEVLLQYRLIMTQG